MDNKKVVLRDFSELSTISLNHHTSKQFRPKLPKYERNGINIYRDGQLWATAIFDRNDQLCDIQPRTQATEALLNQYRGRPYSIIVNELTEQLKLAAYAEEQL